MHYWGDDWEHWGELYSAIVYFNKMYHRITGVYPITKEKYGSMRFECTYAWIDSEQRCKVFKLLIRKMITKFPNVRAEICDDAQLILDDLYFEGWCAGIAYAANGSYWRSDKRPMGV